MNKNDEKEKKQNFPHNKRGEFLPKQQKRNEKSYGN